MAELSPMMKQYFKLKEQHKNHIMFFRLGDFYEMFFDDAILASKELELTLTGRDCGLEERAPMCGIPHHSSEGYVSRLVAKGYKVAICEQTQDANSVKGIVNREIVRVITPGTIIESSMLQDDKNNYIASVFIKDNNTAGVSFADISTGIVHTSHIHETDLSATIISQLSRFSPCEVIFNPKLLDFKDITLFLKNQLAASVDLIEQENFIEENTDNSLVNQFTQDYLDICAINDEPEIQASLMGLLAYLSTTQKRGIERLKTIDNYTHKQVMKLSPVTRANLELTQTMRTRDKKGTLLWVLDKTSTAMGKRLLRNFVEQPLINTIEISQRLNCVDTVVKDTLIRGEIIEKLSKISDIERLLTRIVYGNANPNEVYSLVSTIEQLPALKNAILTLNTKEWTDIASQLDLLEDVKDLVVSAINIDTPPTLKDGGVINAGYNQEVDELRHIITGGKGFLTELETKLKQETGIAKLKIGYNRVFGYYIEVTHHYLSLVPDTFIRKQTLANAERYITEELKLLESKILGANERLVVLERELFTQLLLEISQNSTRIQKTANCIANTDVFTSLASVAVKNNYTKPIVNNSDDLTIIEGRHPVVEQLLKDSMFVPNDTILDGKENKMLIITGPNMAGKSTYMRQTALIALMAQIGSFVPAKKCEMGVVDSIFTRVGASDDLSAGQSTFMVEMIEVAEILKYATRKSLVILDEIGRGTSTFDGMSIARSVVEHMVSEDVGLGCKTLFATHYHELTALQDLKGVKNYSIAVKKRGDDITFLRRIVKGPADDSYGIQVAKLAGVPECVIKRAKVVLLSLEKTAPDFKNAITQLDFDYIEEKENNKIPDEVLEKLRDLDVDILTPLEALNYLYEIKKSL